VRALSGQPVGPPAVCRAASGLPVNASSVTGRVTGPPARPPHAPAREFALRRAAGLFFKSPGRYRNAPALRASPLAAGGLARAATGLAQWRSAGDSLAGSAAWRCP
jgi:hypothetical protein